MITHTVPSVCVNVPQSAIERIRACTRDLENCVLNHVYADSLASPGHQKSEWESMGKESLEWAWMGVIAILEVGSHQTLLARARELHGESMKEPLATVMW